MSKVTKVVLIVGGAMVALGIVFSVLGFMVFRNAGFKNGSSKKPEQNVVVISDSFTNIEVSEISDEVIIKPSEDGEVKVEYYDYDEIVHEVDVKGDTLTVKVKDIYGGEPWWTRIQFGFDLERIINNSDYDTRTVIYLPEDSYGSLKVNTVSGEVEVPEKYAFNDVAINTTSGSITCDCTATGDIEIGTVSGEIILNDVESGSLNTNSVSGDVMFTNLTTDDVNIDTTSGEVSGTITGDHEYDVDTVSGDISLPAAIKGEAMVNISTVSGDVDIETA